MKETCLRAPGHKATTVSWTGMIHPATHLSSFLFYDLISAMFSSSLEKIKNFDADFFLQSNNRDLKNLFKPSCPSPYYQKSGNNRTDRVSNVTMLPDAYYFQK